MGEGAQAQIRERVWIDKFDAVTRRHVAQVLIENGCVIRETFFGETTGPTPRPADDSAPRDE